MTQLNITVPLPKPVVDAYGREAKRRTKALKLYVSRSAVMREALTEFASSMCQPTPSQKMPVTSL